MDYNLTVSDYRKIWREKLAKEGLFNLFENKKEPENISNPFLLILDSNTDIIEYD